MSLDDLKRLLQNHFGDGLVTVVGSGLSVAEGVPGMGGLADHLRDNVASNLGTEDKALWAELLPLIEKHGLETALQAKAPSPALEAAIAARTGELFAAHERRVISEVFAGRKLRLTRLLAHMLKPSAGLPIITTNYERLVELAVEEAGLAVDTMFVGRFAGALDEKESRYSFCRGVELKKGRAKLQHRERALVFKPHGSLDWYLRGDRPVCCVAEVDGATRLIITPGQNKFRNGYDSPFDLHRARANEAIDRAGRFLILGYGFNDDHLETHLLPAIKAGKPTLILTRTLSAKAHTLALSHANVVALDFAQGAGADGTRVIRDGVPTFVPGLALWDVNSLVDEVLEP